MWSTTLCNSPPNSEFQLVASYRRGCGITQFPIGYWSDPCRGCSHLVSFTNIHRYIASCRPNAPTTISLLLSITRSGDNLRDPTWHGNTTVCMHSRLQEHAYRICCILYKPRPMFNKVSTFRSRDVFLEVLRVLAQTVQAAECWRKSPVYLWLILRLIDHWIHIWTGGHFTNAPPCAPRGIEQCETLGSVVSNALVRIGVFVSFTW